MYLRDETRSLSLPVLTSFDLVTGKLRYFILEIVVAFAQTFAHFVTRESPNRHFLAGLGDLFGDEFADSLGRLFNKRLVKQDKLFIEFVQPAFDNLVDN